MRVIVAIVFLCFCAIEARVSIKVLPRGSTQQINSYQSSYGHEANTAATPKHPPPPPLDREPHAYDAPPATLLPDLEHLNGECFELTTDSYIYEVCPFQNVTQKSRFTTLHVVLGVWNEWQMTNSKGLYMLFNDGSPCSNGIKRNTKVIPRCPLEPLGDEEVATISDVIEPDTCQYELYFNMQAVCGNDADEEFDEQSNSYDRNFESSVLDGDSSSSILHIAASSKESKSSKTGSPDLTPRGYEELVAEKDRIIEEQQRLIVALQSCLGGNKEDCVSVGFYPSTS